jgi:hypothetical protein
VSRVQQREVALVSLMRERRSRSLTALGRGARRAHRARHGDDAPHNDPEKSLWCRRKVRPRLRRARAHDLGRRGQRRAQIAEITGNIAINRSSTRPGTLVHDARREDVTQRTIPAPKHAMRARSAVRRVELPPELARRQALRAGTLGEGASDRARAHRAAKRSAAERSETNREDRRRLHTTAPHASRAGAARRVREGS